MPSQQRSQILAREGRIGLAIASFQADPSQSICKLAAAYDVPKTTLRRRLQGVAPKHETRAVDRKLYPSEEQALVQWILDLDRRGFPPQIIDVNGWQTLYSPRAVKILLQTQQARSGHHALSRLSQSSRLYGTENFIHSGRCVRILLQFNIGSSVFTISVWNMEYSTRIPTISMRLASRWVLLVHLRLSLVQTELVEQSLFNLVIESGSQLLRASARMGGLSHPSSSSQENSTNLPGIMTYLLTG